MFESYSDRARRVVFLSRKIAGRRGAAEIGVEDLIEALIVEDQGDFLKVFSEEMAAGVAVQWMAKHLPFFTAETAAAIHRELEPMLAPKGERLATSVDMPVAQGLQQVLKGAKELSDELRQDSRLSAQIGPLHLLAATLSNESSEVAKILKQTGVGREAVISAIRSGESAE
jgi:ATP-dependent Clp protease ATP-binding subunit ClpA